MHGHEWDFTAALEWTRGVANNCDTKAGAVEESGALSLGGIGIGRQEWELQQPMMYAAI